MDGTKKTELSRAESIFFSINELSDLTGFAFPTVKKRLEAIESRPGPHGSILYPLKASVRAIYAAETNSLTELKLQREREETRLASAKARKCELDNALREKVIIPVEEAERTYAELIVAFKAKLLTIPSKAAFELFRYREPEEIESHLHLQISEAIDELTHRVK